MVHDTVYYDKRPIDVKPVYFMANNFRLSRSEQAMQLPLKFLEIVYWLACRTALKQELLRLATALFSFSSWLFLAVAIYEMMS